MWLVLIPTVLVVALWLRLVVIVRRARRVPSTTRVAQVRAQLRAVPVGDEVLIAPGTYSSLSVEMIKEVARAEGCGYLGDRSVIQKSSNRRVLVFTGATLDEPV